MVRWIAKRSRFIRARLEYSADGSLQLPEEIAELCLDCVLRKAADLSETADETLVAYLTVRLQRVAVYSQSFYSLQTNLSGLQFDAISTWQQERASSTIGYTCDA